MEIHNNNVLKILIAIGFCFGSSGLILADTVELKTGRNARGTVVQMNANSVTIKLSTGKEQVIKSADVDKISFDGEPVLLRTARRNASEQQFNRVEENLISVDPATPFQTKEKEFLIAVSSAKLALRGEAGKTIPDAVKTMEAYVGKRENQFWYQYFDALETLGDLQVSANQLDKAVTQYGMLSKSSSDSIKMVGGFKSAQVNVLLEKFSDAKTSFASVQADPSTEVAATKMKLLAKVGEARCDCELGKAKESIQSLLALIKKEDPSEMELFGRAYNALGHCYLKDGQSKAALLSFLHTDVLYQRDPEIHAESLYQLIRLWQTDQKPAQSLAARKLIREKYRNTYWGSKELNSN